MTHTVFRWVRVARVLASVAARRKAPCSGGRFDGLRAGPVPGG